MLARTSIYFTYSNQDTAFPGQTPRSTRDPFRRAVPIRAAPAQGQDKLQAPLRCTGDWKPSSKTEAELLSLCHVEGFLESCFWVPVSLCPFIQAQHSVPFKAAGKRWLSCRVVQQAPNLGISVAARDRAVRSAINLRKLRFRSILHDLRHQETSEASPR